MLRTTDDPTSSATCQPRQQFIRISNRCREANALKVSCGQPLDTLQEEQQMPTTIIARKGVKLIHDYGADIPQQRSVINPRRDHYGF